MIHMSALGQGGEQNKAILEWVEQEPILTVQEAPLRRKPLRGQRLWFVPVALLGEEAGNEISSTGRDDSPSRLQEKNETGKPAPILSWQPLYELAAF